MASKNPRFDYKQEDNQLSPFSYNPAKPASKEFNKLFVWGRNYDIFFKYFWSLDFELSRNQALY